jgi:hypothetical protein
MCKRFYKKQKEVTVKTTIGKLGITVIILAIIAAIMGIIFLQQGFSKQSLLMHALKQENITFEIDGKQTVIDSAEKAQKAGDTVREHRHSIAPTYGDLLGGKNFDPTNPKQLTYAQALNLENYLYLAVASFGLVTVVLASGGFMLLTGITLGLIGFALIKIAKE